jgi:hypothetical protein
MAHAASATQAARFHRIAASPEEEVEIVIGRDGRV